MTWDEVLSVVQDETATVLPGVTARQVTPDVTLSELGANSLDRMDIVVGSQDVLGVSVPAAAFADVGNVRQLVDVLHGHCGTT
ncbi:MAG TPA: phosphopantetheine-binding protein [Trebonia sp.]|jgi:polyketide biosynthesis acyl carrier protein|nr:phosphopantetheine-binding protein [Trebonia sp.]